MSITARKAGRFLHASCPAWLVVLWIICGFIPTPFEIDEILPAILTVVVLGADWRRLPRGLSAFRSGSKSHRDRDHGTWNTGVVVGVWA